MERPVATEPSPYAAPRAAATPEPRLAPMFGYASALLASVLGLGIGGAIVMAFNFLAMGRPRAAVATPVLGIGMLVCFGWAATKLQVPVPVLRWSAGGLWLAILLVAMHWSQGRALALRRAAGVRMRSWWLAPGIGLLLHLALLAAFLAMSRVPISIDLPAP